MIVFYCGTYLFLFGFFLDFILIDIYLWSFFIHYNVDNLSCYNVYNRNWNRLLANQNLGKLKTTCSETVQILCQSEQGTSKWNEFGEIGTQQAADCGFWPFGCRWAETREHRLLGTHPYRWKFNNQDYSRPESFGTFYAEANVCLLYTSRCV